MVKWLPHDKEVLSSKLAKICFEIVTCRNILELRGDKIFLLLKHEQTCNEKEFGQKRNHVVVSLCITRIL